MRTALAAALACCLAGCIHDPVPQHASGAACDSPEACAVVPCTCGDGTFVRAQHCINGRCQVDGEACPGACAGHGGWVRADAGPLFCAADGTCPEFTCTCEDGGTVAARHCQMSQCLGESSVCGSVCFGGARADCGWPGDACDGGAACCSSECMGGMCSYATVREPPG